MKYLLSSRYFWFVTNINIRRDLSRFEFQKTRGAPKYSFEINDWVVSVHSAFFSCSIIVLIWTIISSILLKLNSIILLNLYLTHMSMKTHNKKNWDKNTNKVSNKIKFKMYYRISKIFYFNTVCQYKLLLIIIIIINYIYILIYLS